LNLLAAATAITLSHPFEVARVLTQGNPNAEKSGCFGSSTKILRGIYNSEGVLGLYKGFAPRAIYYFPIMLALAEYSNPKTPFGVYLRRSTDADWNKTKKGHIRHRE
jgi:hypothetical protein